MTGSSEQMTEATNNLNKVNANLFGLVLNRAPRKGLGNSYYASGYANSYVGYATYYGYSKDGTKKKVKSRKKAKKSGLPPAAVNRGGIRHCALSPPYTVATAHASKTNWKTPRGKN